ncbi:MAG: hypothetical protein ABI904_18165 [Chloroflexota bacterium]
MTIQEIKKAITELSQKDLARFRRWFEEFDAQAWDERFEHDTKSGKLDKLADKALFEKRLKKLQGSLKGSGALKALMEERRKG